MLTTLNTMSSPLDTGYISGTIYTNKLSVKNFPSHEDEKESSIAAGLHQFIDMTGLLA